MVGTSWTHRIARLAILPLVGTRVTPNHLTTLRLVTGLAACAMLAIGERSWDIWGGVVWVVSAFLDRADGELARVSGKSSAWGHTYDYICDEVVNAAFFVAIGIGLRHSPLGDWAPVLGILTAGSLLSCGYWSEMLERQRNDGSKAYSGIWGFDFDDLLYLLGPLAWLDWLLPVLICATAGAFAMAVLTGLRLHRLRRSNA
jgi:phosphatidylglycerophosphate synthase